MNGKFGGGEGTPTNPYLIEDIYDFNEIRKGEKLSYKLVNDIDFSLPPYDKGFLPIPSFSGQLDGNGHKLMNLYIDKMDYPDMYTYVGLFEQISITNNQYTAVNHPFIKNLIITNANIKAPENGGIIVGKLMYRHNSGTLFQPLFENVYISGKVQAKYGCGGFVGSLYFYDDYADYKNVMFKNIQANLDLLANSASAYVSPLAGYVYVDQGQVNSNYFGKAGFTFVQDSIIKCKFVNNNQIVKSQLKNIFNYDTKITFPANVQKMRVTNSIFITDDWAGDLCDNIVTMSQEEINHLAKTLDFKLALEDNKQWSFVANKMPKLSVMNSDYCLFYKKSTKQYFGLDLKEVKIFNILKHLDLTFASTDVSNSIINDARKKLGDIQVVAIMNLSLGKKVVQQPEIALNSNSANNYSGHFVFRKKISFPETGKDIYKIVGKNSF